jgi:hypothetical protein
MYPIAIHARRRRGSALSLGILVSVILTGLVMAMAWALGAQTEVAAVRARADDARYAADAALTWSMYQLRQDPAWRPTTSPMQTAMVNGWTCKITYVDLGPSLLGTAAGVLGNPLKFTVVATRSDTPASATVVATIQGVLAYAPAFWATSNLTVAQSAKVVGDVETLGSLTINGPGASPLQSATGIWKARGLLTDNNPAQTNTYFTNPTKPAGSIATLAAPPQTVTQIYNNLLAGPTVPVSSILTTDPGTGKLILDFTKAGGKPVVVSGGGPYSYGSAVGIKQSGTGNDTLVLDNSVTFSGGFPFNQASATFNLVIKGNATLSPGPLNFNGSFYVKGNWTQGGSYAIKGTIVCEGTCNIGGTGTVNVSQPPSFDPRYLPTITNYYGNLP